MAAPSGDGNQQQEHQQQQPAVNAGEDFPEEQLPSIVGAVGQDPTAAPDPSAEATPDRPAARRRAYPRQGREPSGSPARRSLRALRLWRRLTASLVQWFAARPLGQRALEAVGHTIATAERATRWAGAASQQATDCPPLPFAWYFMMPVVMALMVVRTGAALAERYLNVQLPHNKELVNWFEGQRTHLEKLQAAAALHIRTIYVDENDTMHRFLNRWPFNIPYRAAQQLGIIPVRVNEQPSDTSTDSTSVPTLEPITSTSSSSSTLTAGEEPAEPVSRELTPPPEAALDHTLYFSPADERLTKEESDKEEQEQQQKQDDKQEEVEGESAQEKSERPAITEEESVETAVEAVSPEAQPSPPEHKPLGEQERAAMQVPPQPTSEGLLAAERAATSAPTSSGVRKAAAKSSKTSFLVNLFATKLA